jgi:toxin ParE1/3/4
MAHRVSALAQADLDQIWDYLFTESGSTEIARRQILAIVERFILLSDHPHLGRPREDLRPGLRSFPVGDYVVVYSVKERDVMILRVVHGRRDMEELFG